VADGFTWGGAGRVGEGNGVGKPWVAIGTGPPNMGSPSAGTQAARNTAINNQQYWPIKHFEDNCQLFMMHLLRDRH
jgi:hypothetical protein